MAKVSNWPLNQTWANLTSNKISFTQTEVSAGISYKGPIVSNQLNGVSHLLSTILQFNQAANGYYQPNMTYHKGNFVSIVHTGNDYPMQVETYMCIDDAEGQGITNQSPLLVASSNSVNGVTQYVGGIVNSQYWKRIDVGNAERIKPISVKNVNRMQSSDYNLFCALLMTVPDINFDKNSTKPERTKEIRSKLSLTCKCGNNWSTVDFRIEGKYLRNDDAGNYIKPTDYFNMPVPNIYIDDIHLHSKNNNSYTDNNYTPSTVSQTIDRTNIQSINRSPSKDRLMNGEVTPYGFNFAIGYTSNVDGKRNWGIYVVSRESTEFELEGTSTIPVTLTQISDQTLTVMNIIPVRPKGGANSYEQLLELVEYDEISANYQNPLLYFSRGQVELREAATVNNGKFSCYKILGRMQTLSVGLLKEHTGRHTRAYGGAAWPTNGSIYAGSKPGELLEPGLPNVFFNLIGVDGMNIFLASTNTKRINWANNNYGPDFAHPYRQNAASAVACDASLGSSIYKPSMRHGRNQYGLSAPQFNDVRPKAISIRRCLKCF